MSTLPSSQLRPCAWRLRASAIGVAVTLVLSGCADPIETLRPRGNGAPETFLTSGPPASESGTSYRVHFFWYGIDPDADGSIDHFEFIIVDHPSRPTNALAKSRPVDRARPGGAVGTAGNIAGITVPALDDPRWTPTTATDSIFITSADSLHRDPEPGPGENPGDVLGEFFERWHTFFIRAVDDRGVPDPTPEHRSFNARTLAPVVWLTEPVRAGQVHDAPPSLEVRWAGADPIDEFTWQEPDSSRWVLITSAYDPDDPDTFVSFPESLYALPVRSHWSPWRAWDAEDGSGTSATLTELVHTSQGLGSGFHIFAVQAKDEAGAVTPVFDWRSPRQNNVALIRVTSALGPLLWIREPNLGMHQFATRSRPVELVAAAGVPLELTWQGDASDYGGTIAAYRYAWNLVNPPDDEEWDSEWDPGATSTRRTLTVGVHRLYVEARDRAGLIVRAVLLIDAYPFTKRHPLLFVDDAVESSPQEEADADQRWQSALGTVANDAGFEFSPVRDIFDVVEVRGAPPPVEMLFDYEAVVWYTVPGAGGVSVLRQAGQFGRPWIECGRHPCRGNFNVLKAYLAAGGKLWVNGFRPARQLWTDLRVPEHGSDPVNVPHGPDAYGDSRMDSLGTSSLLYQLGVEMFDVGAALDSPRRTLEHFCQGIATALPGAPDLEVDPLRWATPLPQPGGLAGRANVEIYNMPRLMSQQQPPLLPPTWRTAAPYTYVSGVPAEWPTVYPNTADGQSVFLLTKARRSDPGPSRAICGFSPHLLTIDSHTRLVRYVLVDQMSLGASHP